MSEIHIFVDADSVPPAIRATIMRRALKENLPTLFVADRRLRDVIAASEKDTAERRRKLRESGESDERVLRAARSKLREVTVPSREGAADDYLVSHLVLPALAITHDIPLASRLIAKGAVVLDDRGHVYTGENIAPRLSERNTNTILREWGVMDEKTSRMDASVMKAFADAFDRTLGKMKRNA